VADAPGVLEKTKKPGRACAHTEPRDEAWSHGSAPHRGHPQRDSPRPVRVASQPPDLGGPLTSAVAPSGRVSGSRSSATVPGARASCRQRDM